MISVSEPKRLYLLRHAHTVPPTSENSGEFSEPMLSPKGIEQAEHTANFLAKQVQFEAIFCTGLKRTIDTAISIARQQNLEVESEPELNEVPLGLAPNASYKTVLEAYSDLCQSLEKYPLDQIVLPTNISFNTLLTNYLSAIQRILSHQGTHIALVAHGGTNLILLCYFMGLPYHRLLSFYQENCCINIIDCLPSSNFIVRQINHTCWDPLKTTMPIQWKPKEAKP